MVLGITKWLVFGVAISLLPLFAAYILCFVSERNEPYFSFIGKGELLLIAVGICANTIGNLIGTNSLKSHDVLFVSLCGGTALLTLVICSLLFASFTTTAAVDAERVADVSILLYSFAVFTGISSIVITEKAP